VIWTEVTDCPRTLRGYFAAHDEEDDRHVNLTRAYACEIVAWRFAAHLSERDAIDYLLYEEEPAASVSNSTIEAPADHPRTHQENARTVLSEQTPLLHTPNRKPQRPTLLLRDSEVTSRPEDFQALASSVRNLNALEIAAVTDAKKFLSQTAVQRVIDGIWKGEGITQLGAECLLTNIIDR